MFLSSDGVPMLGHPVKEAERRGVTPEQLRAMRLASHAFYDSHGLCQTGCCNIGRVVAVAPSSLPHSLLLTFKMQRHSLFLP